MLDSSLGSTDSGMDSSIVASGASVTYDSGSFSSGRIKDWKNLLNTYKKEFRYFGYGAQADRYLINQSASNGILYALSSSGIAGIFFYFIFISARKQKI